MGGGGNPDTKTSGALPWWIQGAHQGLVDNAEAWAYGERGGYQDYEGQTGMDRIAGLTDREMAANQAREEIFNRGDIAGQFSASNFDAASALNNTTMGVANSEFTGDEYMRRRNPYIDNVVGREIDEAKAQYRAQMNQSQANNVARGGSIGSYRVGLENQFAQSEMQRGLADIRARGELDAYNQALGSFQADRATKLGGIGQAVDSYQQIGLGGSQVGTESLAREQAMTNELDRAGAIEREMQQKYLTQEYGDWVEQRDYPKKNMEFLSGILTGVPTGSMTTQTTTGPQPGLVSQLAGMGLGAAAISQYV